MFGCYNEHFLASILEEIQARCRIRLAHSSSNFKQTHKNIQGVIFLNYASSSVALVFYLPGVCTHTYTKGKQRKARVGNILKSSKNTIFNEHVELYMQLTGQWTCSSPTTGPKKLNATNLNIIRSSSRDHWSTKLHVAH